MATTTVTAATIKTYLLDGCGYEAELVEDDYQFAQGYLVK